MDRTQLDDATQKTLDKLKVTRQTFDGSPAEEVRKRLQESLHQTLATLPPDDAARMLERLREALVTEARDRQERLEVLENVARRLESENTTLKREKDELARRLATQPPSPAAAAGSSSGGLGRVRAALTQVSDGGALTEESVNLSREDVQLLQLIQLLYQFAVDVSTTSQKFVVITDQEQGNTVATEFGKEVRKRFKNCLANQSDSLQELNEVLSRSRRFIPALNEAHMRSIRAGAKTILTALDPEPVAEKHRGRLGNVNFEQAWRTLSNIHADLRDLPSRERWDTYFRPTFTTELIELFEGKASKPPGSSHSP